MAPARLLSLLAPPLCWSCGSPARPTGPLCGGCRTSLRWLQPEAVELPGVALWAPVAYDGAARALVRALKFRGALGLADAMAAQIAARAPPALVTDTTLVPVPLHPARWRARGFNQAERLARALAGRLDLPVAGCLARVRAAAPQTRLGRRERLDAPAGTIALVPGYGPGPERPVLVDDVVTTGATLAACASALRARGAAGPVGALAYARTLGR